MNVPLVSAEHVSRVFSSRGWLRRSPGVQAVHDLSLTVRSGEAIGLVGESGSGKSTIGRLMLGLLPPSTGRVMFQNRDLAGLSPAEFRPLRRRMQLVFQDPYSSLDPRRRAGSQIADGLLLHARVAPAEAPERVVDLLRQVGLSAEHADRFPHEFSGGQRQRIGIARALATGPDFLVADEPVSALDVSVQAQILALLTDLRSRLGLAMLFISHDLAAVRHLCERVVVLYLGRVVEEGPTSAVFANPRHPYTAALLSSAPSLDPTHRRRRIVLQGELPSPANPPTGCVFHTRCPYVLDICRSTVPALAETGQAGHHKACVRDDLPPLAPVGHEPGL